VVWPQNHSDGFSSVWAPKPMTTVCQSLGLKTTGTVSHRFGPQNRWRWFVSGVASKPTATVSSGLALKPVAMVSASLASKPAVTVSGGLTSKHAATVSSGEDMN
jgi:hypothetical protein